MSQQTIKQWRQEKQRFLHTLILGDQKQTGLFFLMLNHVQKIATFEHK